MQYSEGLWRQRAPASMAVRDVEKHVHTHGVSEVRTTLRLYMCGRNASYDDGGSRLSLFLAKFMPQIVQNMIRTTSYDIASVSS
jgi:hypothetical protein